MNVMPGTKRYVRMEGGVTIPYVLDLFGVWHPVALGKYPYIGTDDMGGREYKTATRDWM